MTQLQRASVFILFSIPLAGCLVPVANSGREPTEKAVAIEPNELEVSPIASDFDPCEEIRRQLGESRRAYSLLGAGDVAERRDRAELALRQAETAADESREAAHAAANEHLSAQNELRRVEAQRSDEADAFCREVLELSGVGDAGSITKRETAPGTHWVAFTVLEDPATDVYYLELEEDPNSGERNRIALQETMFTEFPKYWDRTRETRDRLNLATLGLASTLREKREAEEAAKAILERIPDAREFWYASCEASQRAATLVREMVELDQSLERCAGGEGLAGRLQRIELRLESLQLRSDEAVAEFGRTRDDISVVAPPGYRKGTQKHLDAAWTKLTEIREALESAQLSTTRAFHAFGADRRDRSREHATRAQRGCDLVEGGMTSISKHLERARFAAEEGHAMYFQDGPEVRTRNAALSRMDLDGLLLAGLRGAVAEEELNESWTTLELWSGLPVWLSGFETDGVLRVPEESLEEVRALVHFLEDRLRPCEPKSLKDGIVRSLLAQGHARTEQEAYLLLGESCGLMRRFSAMLSEL